jgi:hypothetical protein
MANNIPSVLPTSRKYFYFRTVTTLATDDGDVDNSGAGSGNDLADATSMMVPVSAFRGAQPSDDNTVILYFDPLRRHDDRGADSVKNCDTVALRHDTANQAKKVLTSILEAAAGKSFQSQSMIVVADDVTSTYLEGVSSVGTITINIDYA